MNRETWIVAGVVAAGVVVFVVREMLLSLAELRDPYANARYPSDDTEDAQSGHD